MPIPENLTLYGNNATLDILGHRQPRPNQFPSDEGRINREQLRTITLHFTQGWKYGNWQSSFAVSAAVNLKQQPNAVSPTVVQISNGGTITFPNNDLAEGVAWTYVRWVQRINNNSIPHVGYIPTNTIRRRYYGAPYNVDLDGRIYQSCEVGVKALHVSGRPHFSSSYSFANNTSIGIEIAKFGAISQANDLYYPRGYTPANNSQIPFTTEVADADISVVNYTTSNAADLENSSVATVPADQRTYNIKKIPGGTLVQKTSNNNNNPYHFKVQQFGANRNPYHANQPFDFHYTEEQMDSLIGLLKALCEQHNIPKKFVKDPDSGEENPWIATNDIVKKSTNVSADTAEQKQLKERVMSFRGIIGHINVQRGKWDPGAACDYYRIKRGISDEWWYPINLDATDRPIHHWLPDIQADYVKMPRYGDLDVLEKYYTLTEDSNGGYFPLGKNKLWHGGIHLPHEVSRKVYAAANGTIVAAQVSKLHDEDLIDVCFVLIKHDVHIKNTQADVDRIDYDDATNLVTADVYSLYMHLTPSEIRYNEEETEFNLELVENPPFNEYPKWLYFFMLDNPDSVTDIQEGTIIYPNQKVVLSDHIGNTGRYYNGNVTADNNPEVGRTLHFEVFSPIATPDDLAQPNNWHTPDAANQENQVEDTDHSFANSLDTINQFLQDTNKDGIDAIDIKNAISSMRNVALKRKSEWSLASKNDMATQLSIEGSREDIDTILTQEKWDKDIRPLQFYQDLSQEVRNEIFGEDTLVWHYHPWAFMEWINRRIEKHETEMETIDKSRDGNRASTITVDGEYVTGFVNAVTANTNTTVKFNERPYEVRLRNITDAASLVAGTTSTKIHFSILEFLDILNDTDSNFTINDSYLLATSACNCGVDGFSTMHYDGNAIDLVPTGAVSAQTLWRLFRNIENAICFINTGIKQTTAVDDNLILASRISYTTDPDAAINATRSVDALEIYDDFVDFVLVENPDLTNIPMDHIGSMIIHVGLHDAMPQVISLGATGSQWLDENGDEITENISFSDVSELQMKTTLSSIKNAQQIQFNIIGYLAESTTEKETIVTVNKSTNGLDQNGKGDFECDVDISKLLTKDTFEKYSKITFQVTIPKGTQLIDDSLTAEDVNGLEAAQSILWPKVTEWGWSSSKTSLKEITKVDDDEVVYVWFNSENIPGKCKVNVAISEISDDNSTEHAQDLSGIVSSSGNAGVAWVTPEQRGFRDIFGDKEYVGTVTLIHVEGKKETVLCKKELKKLHVD